MNQQAVETRMPWQFQMTRSGTDLNRVKTKLYSCSEAFYTPAGHTLSSIGTLHFLMSLRLHSRFSEQVESSHLNHQDLTLLLTFCLMVLFMQIGIASNFNSMFVFHMHAYMMCVRNNAIQNLSSFYLLVLNLVLEIKLENNA